MKHPLLIATICLCVTGLPIHARSQERALSERCWAKAKEKDEAIEDCTALIRSGLKGKDLAVAFEGRAFAYTMSKKYASAISDYNEAIRLRPDFWDIYFERAMAYALSGDIERATDDYARVVALNPKKYLADVNARAAQLGAIGGKFEGDVEIAYSFLLLGRLVCRYHPAMKQVCPSDLFGHLSKKDDNPIICTLCPSAGSEPWH